MNKLKTLRKENNLTQEELAKKIGVNLRTLQKWENGESSIRTKNAKKLAKHFGVSVGYLLGYENHKDPVLSGVSSIDEILNEYHGKLNTDGEIDLKLYNEISNKLFASMGRIAFSTKSSQEIRKVENRFFSQSVNEIKKFHPDILKLDNANFLLNQHGFLAIEQFYKAIDMLPTEERELVVNYVTLKDEDRETVAKLTKSLSEKTLSNNT
ncbi:helix-turn-helix transcriptional regulator [Streptococcus suis]|uniref:Transcriptional regulator n=1 Tax=Streptococcus suis TaxID=1307 RepID=A0A0Z8MUC1_STRSU|nr:helix-turn-helix transcriptional regulator [Streptococcus suis]NQG66331.1 helix-turn-helix transcriptional regulator [Streptococcus suis]NQG68295.1 helix-turn-helix transcriptional regulator [Streptococcus suis]CYW15210.1 transcriptional regulator [Streptococcus suis]CYW20136.1 transcriptional regulator [Streptococcus suis]HEL2204001.1 helix-turn-helix transcriptional regulator [Streptococcus suis]